MRYSGAGTDYHEWNDFNNIRTVFWVIRADSDNNGFMPTGDDGEAHFHNNLGNPLTFSSDSWSSANVRNGNLAVNGTRNINGTTAGMNTSLSNLSVVSLKTDGNVEASRFCRDRSDTSRNWKGDLGELIIYNSELSPSEIEKIEGYLAHKWGLTLVPSLIIMHTKQTRYPLWVQTQPGNRRFRWIHIRNCICQDSKPGRLM